MADMHERDFEDSIMNNACSDERATHVDIYMGTLSSFSYSRFAEKDKEFVIGVHRHLKNCAKCRDYYTDAKKDAASNPAFSGFYKPESFRLLRENERYLDSLITILK